MKLPNVLQFILAGVIIDVDANGQTIGPAECFAGFISLNYSTFNYDRYHEFYREDSTLTLAQTGVYTGPRNIEEYVRVADPISPFIAASTLGNNTFDLGGIDGETCTFVWLGIRDLSLNHTLVGAVESFRVPALHRFEYDAIEGYIKKYDVYYTEQYLKDFFSAFDADMTRDYVCGVMKKVCGHDVGSDYACRERLRELPLLTDGSYLDGNSQGCRVFHSFLSTLDPDGHCAHIAFEPTEDPSGKIKCQESAGRQISDLFGEEELAAFERFCIKNEIDPKLGYVLFEDQVSSDELDQTSSNQTGDHSSDQALAGDAALALENGNADKNTNDEIAQTSDIDGGAEETMGTSAGKFTETVLAHIFTVTMALLFVMMLKR